MNNRSLLLLFLSISSTTSVWPITIEFTCMEQPKTGKKVALLGDAHVPFSEGKKEGQHDLIQLTNRLFAQDPQIGLQAIVATESNPSVVGRLYEQEAGFVEKADTGQAIEVVAREMIKNHLASHSGKELKPQAWPEGFASLSMKNNFRWVPLDRGASELDNFLALKLHKWWKEIKADLGQEHFPPQFDLSIADTKKYINETRKFYEKQLKRHKRAHKKLWGEITADYHMMSKLLSEYKGSETDHITFFHEQLVNQGTEEKRIAFGNALLRFLRSKFDVELLQFIDVLEKDPEIKSLLIQVGAEHTPLILQALTARGYQTVKKVGGIKSYDENSDADAYFAEIQKSEIATVSDKVLSCLYGPKK